MSTLELRDVVAGFESGSEIGPINLSIEQGKMLALLGASGSGKTTTLRLIAGLHNPISGDIVFRGNSLAGLSAKKRKVGMVFQNFGLFPHMTVEKNITFGPRMNRLSNAEISTRLIKMIKAMKLEGLEQRFPHQLSGGQQQRAALARTLILDPDILLLDEPLSNLDANLRKETASFISGLQREFEITTVFVTHDQEEALLLADQVAILDQGTVLQTASPRDICEKPRSKMIANFMGAENLIPVSGQVGADLETPLGTLRVLPDALKINPSPVCLMVRPEHIGLTDPNSKVKEAGANQIAGRVLTTRYLGGDISYRIQVKSEILSVRTHSRSQFTEGQEVMVSVFPETLWPISH